ncbi:NAD(P)-binding protein [Xylona heveae TC161]|uniref:NAD(P)-binding protein n=1 Tax=Xylona heveae (strain CBS 132557 / TC161) TaxID=1328760 RepID=A0A165AIE7_XYLHT|nr:NAD(P)-binding protein [Xylona heveae TC161]KZF20530.1 NAD(P)-binding protein [Xylona heveae TC161]
MSFENKVFGNGAVLGCDFVGTVVAAGNSVSRIGNGDKVAGLVWGGETKGIGAFSEYTIADEKICFRVPADIPSAEAVTIPLAGATAWLALFSHHCLKIRREVPHQSILIWGGSSSVGQYAIQIAALYGFNIATTCSPKNFDLVKSLGAKHAFDYKSDDVAEQIKAAVPNLVFVFDTIGAGASSATASKAVTGDGVLCTVRPGKANTEHVAKNVRVTDVLVFTAFLKEHNYGALRWPALRDDHELASEFYDRLPHWLESVRFKPNSILLLKGLDSVTEGFDLYKQGKISAKKVVYEL